MTTYELTVILPVDKEKAVFDKVKNLLDTAGAKITKTDEWGKRALAYPINKQSEGVYYCLTLDMDTDKTQAVNRVLENDDDILRHLIVVAAKKVQDKHSLESKDSNSTSTRKEKVVEKVEKEIKVKKVSKAKKSKTK